MSYFSGRVHSVIFENPTQGFYILRMALDGADPILGDRPSVRGNIPGISVQVGTWIGFEGEWVEHEQHGRQIQIARAPVVPAWTPEIAVSMLTANGIAEHVARLLKLRFGEDLVEVLDEGDPKPLVVDGVDAVAAERVLLRWRAGKAQLAMMDFFAKAGVPVERVAQAWALFGDSAEEVLTANPWALIAVEGITFDQVDEVAQRLGLDLSHPKRVEGAVLFACKSRKGLGHLYLTSGEILSAVLELVPDLTEEGLGKAIVSLHRQQTLVVDRRTRVGTTAIYEPWLHRIESESATHLRERCASARLEAQPEVLAKFLDALASTGPQAEVARRDGDLRAVAEAALRDWSTGSQVTLSALQLEGALNGLVQPVSLLTGLPGSGKTTTLKALVTILRDAKVPFLLVAPTGIAAKRAASVTGAVASTIHRAFGAAGFNRTDSRETTYTGVKGGSSGAGDGSDGAGERWGFGSGNLHEADVVICDECSMVDQHLLYRILMCTKTTARLVFIGDDAQLPSVGPGNVLRDMIASRQFPTVALTEIFRQANTSQIVVAAHAINRGEVPETSTSGDFVLVPTRTDEEAFDIVVRIAEKLYGKRERTESFQVLSPRHNGVCGVTNLNARLRERLNPKQPGANEMKLGKDSVIREGDRVMVVKNDYDRGVFNGDVGKVHKLERKVRVAEVKIHGTPVQYVSIPFKEAATYLRLAYCVTVHKMQGQEADVIIMPIVNGFSHQLQRNLLYTAITRARKRVFLVGHPEAMVRAIQNTQQEERNTLFLDRLRAAFSAANAA